LYNTTKEDMGNCFGSSSAVADPPKSSRPTSSAAGPPKKKPRIDFSSDEQQYVTEDVQALRDKAGKYHSRVVDCAKRSQAAWQSGNKAEAKTLSDEKKDWQKKQDASNRKACALILSAQHWETSKEIDLHGLFLDEALEATKDFLKHWTKQAKKELTIVLIITGAGHHSENNKAVIRPKVEELLQDQRLDYESVHGDGAFEVTLKPKQ